MSVAWVPAVIFAPKRTCLLGEESEQLIEGIVIHCVNE